MFRASLFFIILFAGELNIAQYTYATTSTGFSFDFYSGIEHGRVDEEVYESDKCISRLVWPHKAVPFIGFGTDIRLWNFLISGKVLNCFPLKGGVTEDFDFLIPGSDKISLYSCHDTYVDKDFRLHAELGYKIGIEDIFEVSPTVGITYFNRKWTARDGYLQYPAVHGIAWTGNEEKQTVKGAVLSYEQSVLFCSVGIRSRIKISDITQFGGSFFLYPFSRGDSLDNHFLRALEFYDSLYEGYGYGFGCWILLNPFKMHRYIGLRFACDYEKLVIRGNTYTNVIGISEESFTLTQGYTAENSSILWTYTFAVVLNGAFSN